MVTRTVRGLVVSPWFAASAGFVVAAGVLVYTPHALLDPAINVTHCKSARCPTTEAQGAAPPKAAGMGAGQLTTKSPPAANSGPAVSYELQWQNDHGFSMVITLPWDSASRSWHLKLVIPGAAHLAVYGAHWMPSGRDSGTASGWDWTSGHAEAANAAPILYPGLLVSAELVRDQNFAQFVVSGTGAPGAPESCVYNEKPCHFVPLGARAGR